MIYLTKNKFLSSKINTIFFDLDDTLIDSSKAQERAICRFVKNYLHLNNIDFDELSKTWKTISNHYYDNYFKGKIDLLTQREKRFMSLFKYLGIQSDFQNLYSHYKKYQDIYMNECSLFDDVMPCLTKLSNYKLGIISNGLRHIQVKKLKNGKIYTYFEYIITSDTANMTKPHPNIFIHAADISDTKIQNCAYIGDLLTIDIIPSHHSGMQSILIDRYNTHKISYTNKYIKINSLLLLYNILEEKNGNW